MAVLIERKQLSILVLGSITSLACHPLTRSLGAVQSDGGEQQGEEEAQADDLAHVEVVQVSVQTILY